MNTKKTCSLDPLPTGVLQPCFQSLVPAYTHIINMSLSQGQVPASLREAIVILLLKKQSFDPDVLSNYRPVSNLPQLSKTLEKVVATQLMYHANNMSDMYQSAYRKHHSTETALLCVTNVTKLAMDSKKGTILVMIDFVPLYYNTLLDNINIKIGFSNINVVSSVTNLRVRLDRNLKMTAQTSHLMSSCAYQLKLVNSIRASLDVQVAETVVNAIFTSRLDYCNYLLAGLTVQDFTRLQRLETPLQDMY